MTRITRLLWDHLPPEACSFVQDYTAEVDFAIKWFDSVLKPTEPTSGGLMLCGFSCIFIIFSH